MGRNTRPFRYSSVSRLRSSRTAGVIQPPQGLSLGRVARSSTTTSRPASRSFHAQVEPAGPPPTITTSQVRMDSSANRVRVKVGAGSRDLVHGPTGEGDLEELHRAAPEGGLRTRKVQPPGAQEGEAKGSGYRLRGCLQAATPVLERPRVVEAQLLDVEYREVEGSAHPAHHLGQGGGVGTGKNAPLYPGVQGSGTVAADEM